MGKRKMKAARRTLIKSERNLPGWEFMYKWGLTRAKRKRKR